MALEISADIPAHNEDLVGDQLSTLVVNYRWRRILTPLLLRLCSDSFWTGTEAEIEDATYKAIDLLCDLYDCDGAETVSMDYLGVLAKRTTSLLATAAGISVQFSFASGSQAHDVGGFWDSGEPTKLVVPTGGAGYYHCYARGFMFASSNLGAIRIHRGASGVLTSAATTWTAGVSIQCGLVTHFDDGEFITLEARSLGSGRTFSSYDLNPYSFQFGMYRVGLAP